MNPCIISANTTAAGVKITVKVAIDLLTVLKLLEFEPEFALSFVVMRCCM